MFDYDDNNSENNSESINNHEKMMNSFSSDADQQDNIKHLKQDSQEPDNIKYKPIKQESQESESQELNQDEIEELKELIKNWLDLDDKIKCISDEVKDIKMEKKQYETYILEFMDKSKKEVIKTKESTLRKDVKQSKGSPKEETILTTLTQILSDPDQAYKITQRIISNVPSKEIISLKKERSDKKVKKIVRK